MDAEALFGIAGKLVLPGWLILIFLPHWRFGAALITSVIIPVLLGGLYAWLIFAFIGNSDGGFGSLADVRTLFANDYLLLAGWVHYLAFDLFVGSWEVRDSRRLGVHHLAVVPCLVLTFLVGPIGLLVYLAIRFVLKRQFFLERQPETGDR